MRDHETVVALIVVLCTGIILGTMFGWMGRKLYEDEQARRIESRLCTEAGFCVSEAR